MILFETLQQPKILLFLIIFGFFCGLFFDLANLIIFLCNKNKIIKNIFQFFATLASFFVLYLINLNLMYGEFRIYIFAIFFFAMFIERLTLGKIVAKSFDLCYTLFKKTIKLFEKVKQHGKRKKKES